VHRPFDAGFVASRDLTPDGTPRFRAVGPIVEEQAVDGKIFAAVRPFYSRVGDEEDQRLLQDFLWPVAMVKDFRGETYWRVLCAFGHDFDNTQSGSRFRFIVFPIVYTGKDIHGERYFAVFPIGGKVNEFLGRDTIRFVLFPLYMYSAINDVETHDVLWPIVSRTSGHDISRFRVFPFYGQSTRDGLWTKRFAMWPIWTSANYTYPDGQTGGGFVLWPLFGHAKLTDQESWMFLPPFFRWSWNDKGYRAGNSPWPFFQYSCGGNEERLYLWPLWGARSTENYRSSFFLWPIGSTLDVDRGTEQVYRFSIFPFMFYEKKTAKAGVRDQPPSPTGGAPRGPGVRDLPPWPIDLGEPGESGVSDRGSNTEFRVSSVESVSNAPANLVGTGRYFKLWPLISYLREDDSIRIRLPDLWPGKQLSAVERNMAPLWTLYSHVRVDGAGEDELLWGLFRRSNDSNGRRHFSLFPLFSCDRSVEDDSLGWSFLMGLTGYKREGLRKTYRVLYFLRFSTEQEE